MPIYARKKGSQELKKIQEIMVTDALSSYVFADEDEAILVDSDDVTALGSNNDAKIIYGYVTDENCVPTLVYRDTSAPPLLPLAKCSPEAIQEIVNAGIAADLWSVGDVTKDIELNGTVGIYNFENEKYHAMLIGLDHNMDLETSGKHNAVFQFGQNDDEVNIAFVDENYGSNSSGTSCFNMNTSNTNSGGWESCQMRTVICPEFLEVMPADWQEIIGTTTKYTDNVGNNTGSVEFNISATEDKIFLLGGEEVFNGSYANTYEADYQERYAWYTKNDSNSMRIRYRHSAPSSAGVWWLRSLYRSSSYSFCGVNTYGRRDYNSPNYSYGFAPCFTVIADNGGGVWTIDYRFTTDQGDILYLPDSSYTTQLTSDSSIYYWNLINDPEDDSETHIYSYSDSSDNSDCYVSSGRTIFTGIPVEDEIYLNFGTLLSAPTGYNMPSRNPEIMLYKNGTVEEYMNPLDLNQSSILNITKTGEYSVIVEVVFVLPV